MMAIVDAEGRLFGRWNFIDSVVAVLVLGLIPVAYAAYALFRTPPPVLTSIEPTEVSEGLKQRVTVRGVNLRPYLRVSFNTTQGETFLFADSTKAVVDLHPMPPGTYDVILYDLAQEQHRLPSALTVRAGPTATPSELIVTGRFFNLTPAVAAQLKPGAPTSIRGEILETAAPRASVPRVFASAAPLELPTPSQLEVPATMKMQCLIRVTQGFPECGGVEFALRPNYIYESTLPGNVAAPFQIDQVYGAEPVKTISVTVRFAGDAAALRVMNVGDVDVELSRNPLSLGARVASLGPPAGAEERTAVLTVRAQRLPSGWWHGEALRISGPITFRTYRYVVTGTVTSLSDD